VTSIKRCDLGDLGLARTSQQKGVPLSFLKQPWPFKNKTWGTPDRRQLELPVALPQLTRHRAVNDN
jgi:hypothetical protein